MQNGDIEYHKLFEFLQHRIRVAQTRAALSVNAELIFLYWEIGRSILQKQREHGWGAKVIDTLSADLQSSFPGMKGFSTRNLKYMRRFAEVYPELEIVQEVPAQITWYHNTTLLDKVKSSSERLWYARLAIEHG